MSSRLGQASLHHVSELAVSSPGHHRPGHCRSAISLDVPSSARKHASGTCRQRRQPPESPAVGFAMVVWLAIRRSSTALEAKFRGAPEPDGAGTHDRGSPTAHPLIRRIELPHIRDGNPFECREKLGCWSGPRVEVAGSATRRLIVSCWLWACGLSSRTGCILPVLPFSDIDTARKVGNGE